MSASTLWLVEGLVQVNALGPVPVKGLPGPVVHFLLIGKNARGSWTLVPEFVQVLHLLQDLPLGVLPNYVPLLDVEALRGHSVKFKLRVAIVIGHFTDNFPFSLTNNRCQISQQSTYFPVRISSRIL